MDSSSENLWSSPSGFIRKSGNSQKGLSLLQKERYSTIRSRKANRTRNDSSLMDRNSLEASRLWAGAWTPGKDKCAPRNGRSFGTSAPSFTTCGGLILLDLS